MYVITSKLQWKAQHPMNGNLPAIYELCGQYKVPILLHIDPPFGEPIARLEEALRAFAHANVYNPPERIESLLSRHANVYIDFFAGFTVYDPNNQYAVESYIPLIREYAERFFLSTDSATARNLDYEKAINAMYEVIDLCEDDEVRERIARRNFLEIIEAQPATRTQIECIERSALAYDVRTLNKRIANELMIAGGLDNR
ncbi:hypothetical protein PAESOLCIP111_03899 [Paenibacillus solanacearum]|uniref:Amidohydrolase-related domain-containing protein n=1 Tax=Paenibacillus solanacearum TaxID=2048548 RepID=A0A916K6A5_9BACL|nr:hypothetical protein [Paenibacillus solanacearum]CAG7637974.1 hypothetical protein PAESOLCIP111_03899 [Paenibacillus solanacearum]